MVFCYFIVTFVVEIEIMIAIYEKNKMETCKGHKSLGMTIDEVLMWVFRWFMSLREQGSIEKPKTFRAYVQERRLQIFFPVRTREKVLEIMLKELNIFKQIAKEAFLWWKEIISTGHSGYLHG